MRNDRTTETTCGYVFATGLDIHVCGELPLHEGDHKPTPEQRTYRPMIYSPSEPGSEVTGDHVHAPRELTPEQEAKAARELSTPADPLTAEHQPISYQTGSLINLTCTCGNLAVSYVGTPPTEEEIVAKHAEHIAELSAPDEQTNNLDQIQTRIDAYDGSDHYVYVVDGIRYDGHWAHDTRRLLAEVRRLRAEAREQSLLNGQIGNNMIRNNAALHDRIEELTRERDEARAETDRARLAGAQILAEREEARAKADKWRRTAADLAAWIDAIQRVRRDWLRDAEDTRARLDSHEDDLTPVERAEMRLTAILLERHAGKLNRAHEDTDYE